MSHLTRSQTKIFLACMALLASALACGQLGSPTNPSLDTSIPTDAAPSWDLDVVVKGYGISPQGFPADYSRYGDFLFEVSGLPNSGVMFNGAWREDVEGGSDAGQIPGTAANVVRDSGTYGFVPIVVFGWRSDDTTLHIGVPANPTDDWTNEEAKDLFEQMLVDFVSEQQPPYLFLGNESDAYYKVNSEDYARWVAFYNRAYDAIKAASPDTQVGPILQYERMSGQGSFSGWTTPQWGALETHDLNRVDLVGITLYPWLGFATPEEVPDNYLTPLFERIGDKPIAITETGWPGENLGVDAAWEQTPEAQIRFIDALKRILDGADLKILNWLHLYPLSDTVLDENVYQSFGSVSLRTADGEKRPVYDPWVEYLP